MKYNFFYPIRVQEVVKGEADASPKMLELVVEVVNLNEVDELILQAVVGHITADTFSCRAAKYVDRGRKAVYPLNYNSPSIHITAHGISPMLLLKPKTKSLRRNIISSYLFRVYYSLPPAGYFTCWGIWMASTPCSR